MNPRSPSAELPAPSGPGIAVPPTSGAETKVDIRLGEAERRRLTAMFEAHYDLVFRLLRRLGLDAARAEDGAQQVFVVAAKRLVDIASDKERAFLTGTAVNVAYRLRRERTHHEMPSEPPRSGPGADELVDQKRRRELLDGLLAEMEEDLRVVLVLAEVEGQGKREIAEALAIPEGTVASRLRRAREDFVARLKRHQARSKVG